MRSVALRTMLVLAALTVGSDALAADSAGGNIFLDARLGTTLGGSGYGSSNSRVVWGADGGYLWNVDEASSLGFEAGYTHFGRIYEEVDRFIDLSESARATSAGVHYEHLFGEDKAMVFQARAGLLIVRFREDFSFSGVPTGDSESWQDNGVYFGLGIGRKLTRDVSLTLAYDHDSTDGNFGGPQKNLDLNWIGLIAEYRF